MLQCAVFVPQSHFAFYHYLFIYLFIFKFPQYVTVLETVYCKWHSGGHIAGGRQGMKFQTLIGARGKNILEHNVRY